MNFCAIGAPHVAGLWSQISPGLKDLLDNYTLGRWTVPDVLEQLQLENFQLFVVTDGDEIICSMICSILDGHKKTLELALCWGSGVDEWSGQVTDAFDQIGRELGCDQLALDGRPGWRNIMRKHGYELNSVRYTRAI